MEKNNEVAIALQTRYLQNINNPISKEFQEDVRKMNMQSIVKFCLDSKPITLGRNAKENEEKTTDIIMLMLIKFQDFYNCKNKMNKEQLIETAQLILDTFKHLNYYDIAMCFKIAKSNEKIYDRIDGGMILEWLVRYDITRTGLIVTEREKERTRHNSEWSTLSERSSVQKLKDFLR